MGKPGKDLDVICERDHRFNRDLANLPNSQAGPGRHKCAGCAYDIGYWDGRFGKPKHIDLSALDDSQAAIGRHKDAQAAYDLGFDHGNTLRTAGYPAP